MGKKRGLGEDCDNLKSKGQNVAKEHSRRNRGNGDPKISKREKKKQKELAARNHWM